MKSNYALGPWPLSSDAITDGAISLIYYDEDRPIAAIAFDSIEPCEGIVNILRIEVTDTYRRKGIMSAMFDLLRRNGISPVLQIRNSINYDGSLAAFLHGYCSNDKECHEGAEHFSVISTQAKTVYTFEGDEIEDEHGDYRDPWKSLLCSIR